jgi:hypothetical protein
MEIIAMPIDAAMEFLKENERHYKSDAKPLFAIGIHINGALCGAAVVGTRDYEVELCHIYSSGEYHGYTILYGAVWRACKAMGYKKMIL